MRRILNLQRGRQVAQWVLSVIAAIASPAPAPVNAADAHPENVHVASAPAGMEMSSQFNVAVEGMPVPVFAARISSGETERRLKSLEANVDSSHVYETASFACFDQNGPVEVSVTCPIDVSSVKILPTSYHIEPHIVGKTVTFTLAEPRNVTVEVNGNWVNSLHLFASRFETDVPRADDPNVLYFGPGIHEVKQGIHVGDGKTLYLAGGAVLRGVGPGDAVVSLKGEHITLRGRGIIDGSACPYHSRSLLSVRGSDIRIEGVILHDSSTWNVNLRQSDRVNISNLKVLGYRGNSDGIDICNSRDVTVDGCFLRTWDDLIVVKSDHGQGPVHHIIAKNCVLWNTVAHALSVGAELREPIDDVLFTDCDVIHDTGREWTLRIYHCDSAVVTNVRFENIRVEESKRLISLWIGKAIWSREAERGHIKNVVFKNISAVTAQPPKIELHGYDADHLVEDVAMENVQINGKPLTAEQVKENAFVKDLTVEGVARH